MQLIHPKCLGRKCGTWELCSNANILKYGCIYYDDEAIDMEIEIELDKCDYCGCYTEIYREEEKGKCCPRCFSELVGLTKEEVYRSID